MLFIPIAFAFHLIFSELFDSFLLGKKTKSPTRTPQKRSFGKTLTVPPFEFANSFPKSVNSKS
jgi:hypothetical protein